jgi:hypothetical protein
LQNGLPSDAQNLQEKLRKDQGIKTDDQGIKTDKGYVKGMVEYHQKDVKDFQDASENAKDLRAVCWRWT